MENRKRARRLRARRRRSAIGAAVLLALLLAGAVVLAGAAPAGDTDAAQTGWSRLPQGKSALRLNEIMSDNASWLPRADGGHPDWIEFKNTSDAPLSVDGYTLMLDGGAKPLTRLPIRTLGPGELLVLASDGGGLSFRLPAAGAQITLIDPAGAAVDSAALPKLATDEAWCRDADGSWSLSASATPGEDNRITAPGGEAARARALQAIENGQAVITEVMTRAVTQNAGADYIEVRNVSGERLNLQGWRLSDDPDDPAKWVFPDVSLRPGETLLVSCDGQDRRTDAARLSTGFRLSGDGETALLSRADGVTTAVVEIPALNADQAYSLLDEDWTVQLPPTPGAENTWNEACALSDQLLNASGSPLRVNEISAAASGTRPDWIELYNAGSSEVDLSFYALSDNPKNPGKWRFSAGSALAAGAYTGVFCTGDDVADGEWPSANFRLGADGGDTLLLSRLTGDGYVPVDRVYLPPQFEDVTYGRAEGRSGFWYFDGGTPLAANAGAAYSARAEGASYSASGGLFHAGDSVLVTLYAPRDARIRYTLDGSDPTEASPLYETPLSITGTTILRTRVYRDGYLPSLMDTQSYLFDVKNGNGVYVVSMVSDRDNLYSDERGIMVSGPNALTEYPFTGANFMQDWEREGHVEVYGGDGGQLLSSECGLKLQGRGTRSHDQQGFKFIARQKYGDDRFHAALFTRRPYTEYQSFILRPSGQDSGQTRMRDSIFTALADDTSVCYQETEVCVLYINGVYWGHYNMRERVNAESICQFEGWEGQEDDLDMGEANIVVLQGDCSSYADLVEYSKTADPTTDAFYEHVDSVIDIRNYIEYMAIEMFVGNGDTTNVKRYRNANADGKWRWVLFDLDWGFVTDTNSVTRWLTPGGMGSGQNTNNNLFIACMKNPRFRDEFLTYMGERLATKFSTENMIRLFDARLEILGPLLPDHLARWDTSERKYKTQLERLYRYARTRPAKLLKYFRTCKYLNLSDADMARYFGAAQQEIQRYAASHPENGS